MTIKYQITKTGKNLLKHMCKKDYIKPNEHFGRNNFKEYIFKEYILSNDYEQYNLLDERKKLSVSFLFNFTMFVREKLKYHISTNPNIKVCIFSRYGDTKETVNRLKKLIKMITYEVKGYEMHGYTLNSYTEIQEIFSVMDNIIKFNEDHNRDNTLLTIPFRFIIDYLVVTCTKFKNRLFNHF